MPLPYMIEILNDRSMPIPFPFPGHLYFQVMVSFFNLSNLLAAAGTTPGHPPFRLIKLAFRRHWSC